MQLVHTVNGSALAWPRLWAALIENGYQVALMAPTEILAAQHFLSARRIFDNTGYGVELITSGRKRAEREEILARVECGEIKIVVGTHALIEDPVKFNRLGLVIVDEQHRFGVLQRKRLIEKGAAPRRASTRSANTGPKCVSGRFC